MATEAKQKTEAKEKKEKKAKAPTDSAEAAATAAPKAPPPPRTPSDPRLKLVKQLRSKLLPRGVLRDRYRALMERWDSSDNHGGVTVDELSALFADRKAARENPTRLRKA